MAAGFSLQFSPNVNMYLLSTPTFIATSKNLKSRSGTEGESKVSVCRKSAISSLRFSVFVC